LALSFSRRVVFKSAVWSIWGWVESNVEEVLRNDNNNNKMSSCSWSTWLDCHHVSWSIDVALTSPCMEILPVDLKDGREGREERVDSCCKT
jgi:hypothetical protein